MTDIQPTSSRIQHGVSFAAISLTLSDKSSAADPMPTSVLKQVVHLVAPYVTELFNRSLAAGHFPSECKEAFITPIVKKAGTDVSSYPPISNLNAGLIRITLITCPFYHSFSSQSLFANWWPIYCLPTFFLNAAVWFPTGSFDRNRCPPSHVGAPTSRRSAWYAGCANSPRLNGSLRHRRSRHYVAAPAADLRCGVDGNAHRWFRSYLVGQTQYTFVAVLLCWPLITCLHHLCAVCRRDPLWGRLTMGPLLFILYTFDIMH